MAQNVETDFNSLLRVLAQAQPLDVDWYAVAGVAKGPGGDRGPANRCQQKFKKLIESTGRYALINGKVVDLEAGDGATPPVTPAKRGRGGRITATPRSGASSGGKRKAKNDSNEEDSDAEGTPVKKRATNKRAAAVKSAEKIKDEAGSDDEVLETNEDGNDDKASEDGGNEDANDTINEEAI